MSAKFNLDDRPNMAELKVRGKHVHSLRAIVHRQNIVNFISAFRHVVNEIITLLRCYAVYIGSYVTDVSGQPIGPTFKDPAVQEEVMLITCAACICIYFVFR